MCCYRVNYQISFSLLYLLVHSGSIQYVNFAPPTNITLGTTLMKSLMIGLSTHNMYHTEPGTPLISPRNVKDDLIVKVIAFKSRTEIGTTDQTLLVRERTSF